MLVVHHPDQALHDPDTVFRTGKLIPQPDRAERYHLFHDVVAADGHEIVQAPLNRPEAIIDVHDPAYVEFLRTVFARWKAKPGFGPVAIPNVHPTHRMFTKPLDLLGEFGWYSNSTSCPITEGTWPAIYASAQVAIHGADRLQSAQQPIYAMCRPPGHHAYPDLMTGVCYLNNASIAAHQLTKRFGRVALVDIDVHHCNGSQFIFWKRSDVLVCSIHVNPDLAAPFYAGRVEETGDGDGRGYNINLPMPWATPDVPWLQTLDRAMARVKEFDPGALVVSLGFDGGEEDPNGCFKITAKGFAEAARKMAALNVPTLLVQEGGYLSPALASYLRSYLRGFIVETS